MGKQNLSPTFLLCEFYLFYLLVGIGDGINNVRRFGRFKSHISPFIITSKMQHLCGTDLILDIPQFLSNTRVALANCALVVLYRGLFRLDGVYLLDPAASRDKYSHHILRVLTRVPEVPAAH
jgi:hypothetical protein